jgi:hypothetical protein
MNFKKYDNIKRKRIRNNQKLMKGKEERKTYLVKEST